MLYELKYTFYGRNQTSWTMYEAYKTKEQAEKRANILKDISLGRNIEIIEHKKATKYIIDGDGHRQYADVWLRY